jgi:putative ATPase
MFSDGFIGGGKRHPVQQGYLPPHLLGEQFLKKEGDVSDKVWDEMLLRRWERECNDGRPWSGRLDSSTDSGKQLSKL